jgi:AcrR family transcriptional regulator
METRMDRKWDPILKAAKMLFLEKGIDATSMDEIAAKAGTTKRTVYNNFGSKEGLVEAFFDEAAEDIRQQPLHLPLDAAQDALATYATEILFYLTDEFIIGFQRMMIVEGARYPKIMNALRTKALGFLCAPLELWIVENAEQDSIAANAIADSLIAELTSEARLSRLLGARSPYPSGSSAKDANRLESQDRKAVEDFVAACLRLAEHRA